ncbi:hypothetical protein R3P38DRAFT_2795325 [Favolaschia claudopus]|uniref:Uncharacterized protein n=1 Tax=Favolaschia claudopus TaxID=2862362 RepID=A0AAW0A6G9_9AGAR
MIAAMVFCESPDQFPRHRERAQRCQLLQCSRSARSPQTLSAFGTPASSHSAGFTQITDIGAAYGIRWSVEAAARPVFLIYFLLPQFAVLCHRESPEIWEGGEERSRRTSKMIMLSIPLAERTRDTGRGKRVRSARMELQQDLRETSGEKKAARSTSATRLQLQIADKERGRGVACRVPKRQENMEVGRGDEIDGVRTDYMILRKNEVHRLCGNEVYIHPRHCRPWKGAISALTRPTHECRSIEKGKECPHTYAKQYDI